MANINRRADGAGAGGDGTGGAGAGGAGAGGAGACGDGASGAGAVVMELVLCFLCRWCRPVEAEVNGVLMVEPKQEKVEQYIRGLSKNIRVNVELVATRLRLIIAVPLAYQLMGHISKIKMMRFMKVEKRKGDEGDRVEEKESTVPRIIQKDDYDDVDDGNDPEDYDLTRIKASSSKRKRASRQTQRCERFDDGGRCVSVFQNKRSEHYFIAVQFEVLEVIDKGKKSKEQVFTVNQYHDGVFIPKPLRYIEGDVKQLTHVNFDCMIYQDLREIVKCLVHGLVKRLCYCQVGKPLTKSIKELKDGIHIDDFLLLGYENRLIVDLYVEHYDYGVLDFLLEEIDEPNNDSESSDEYCSSDESEDFDGFPK
ncbi:hypothetical protein Tco_0874503 [Tanacetum coccineum]|uniref:PB1-like domain-containing protein n=1 Tax=Tanacetum coccineum TaxID=301880 RepID=A0ABQ5BPM5_9ASTR